MIEYPHQTSLFQGLRLLFILRGSVLPRLLPLAFTTGLMSWAFVSGWQPTSTPLKDIFTHPYAHQVFALSVGYGLVMRCNLAYNRCARPPHPRATSPSRARAPCRGSHPENAHPLILCSPGTGRPWVTCASCSPSSATRWRSASPSTTSRRATRCSPPTTSGGSSSTFARCSRRSRCRASSTRTTSTCSWRSRRRTAAGCTGRSCAHASARPDATPRSRCSAASPRPRSSC